MSPSKTDVPKVWLLLALVGDSESETVSWSAQSEVTEKPATFTVSGSWAQDIADATTEYLETVTSIYSDYATFQGLTDDNIQEGTIGIGDSPEPDSGFFDEGSSV